MAPEQAKGSPVDKRSDVWAFGCVLYEMLTGQRAFDGEDTTEVLDAVVRLEPNWHRLPSDVPKAVRTLMHGCLVKDRQHRIADISTARFVLDQLATLDVTTGPASAAASPARTPVRRRAIPPVAAAVVTGVAVGALTWVATRPVPPRVTRLTVTPTGAAALALDPASRDLAVLPDGTRFVYKGVGAQGGLQLFVRALDQLNGTPGAPAVGRRLGADAAPGDRCLCDGAGPFALRELGVPSADAALQRGAAFLLRTQRGDGSWHVTSRAMKIEPYFESGFPYGHDQWISQAATAWATMGLVMTGIEERAASR